MKAFNLPNTLTAARIILIPVFITALDYEKYRIALYIFAIAAITDKLDGLLARTRDQRTQLGAILDPLADKFMLVTAFVFFTLYGWIPAWLTIMAISRDIIIVTGCVLLYLITHTLKFEPSLPGKLSTAVQFVLLCVVLLEVNFGPAWGLKELLIWVTAFMTGLSGIHYIYKGFRLSGEK